jgi:ATP-dependent DNA helicase RecG
LKVKYFLSIISLSLSIVDTRPVDLLREQVELLKSLNETQWRIVVLCEVPRILSEIMEELGAGSRHYFKTRHLDPLIKGNLIRMTNPENPRASNQKYVLTKTGIMLRMNRPKGKS